MRSSELSLLADEEPQLWVPDKQQRQGVKFLLEHGCAGLLADPGVGKTSIALQALRILLNEGLADRMLVIAPKRPAWLVWPAERAKWKQFNDLRVQVLHGPGREEALKDRKAQLYVITNHHENLQWLFSGGRYRKLVDNCLLGIDESSKFKYMRTQRFQAIRQFLPKFRRRQLFTGSPSSNSLIDLHGQAYLLDLGKTFTPHVSYYRKRYFEDTGYGGYDVKPKPGAEKEIFEKLAPYMLRLEADPSTMPKRRDVPVYVELPSKARRVYDELEEQLFTLIDDREITAFNAGALQTKCAQVASGGVYEDREIDEQTGLPKGGKRKWLALHDVKTEALEDLCGELQGQQLLIGYHWGHDLERLRKLFGKDLAVLGGRSLREDKELERLWLQRRIQYMAGHPSSIGHGLNLQTGGAHHVFWYTLTYDYELYDQFVRRQWRRANPAATVYNHFCVARDTVDEAKVLALAAKARTQNAFFAALVAYRKRRTRARG